MTTKEFMQKVPSDITPGRRQLKMLVTIDERGSKIAINSVFDCHFKNSVSNDFFFYVRR